MFKYTLIVIVQSANACAQVNEFFENFGMPGLATMATGDVHVMLGQTVFDVNPFIDYLHEKKSEIGHFQFLSQREGESNFATWFV